MITRIYNCRTPRLRAIAKIYSDNQANNKDRKRKKLDHTTEDNNEQSHLFNGVILFGVFITKKNAYAKILRLK